MPPTSTAAPAERERRAMRRAIDLGRAGMQHHDGGPFGAVIVRDGEIVGEGWNRVTSTNDPTAHAEVVAIRDACARLGSWMLSGCTLVTSCEPCPMCFAAAHWARVHDVVFGATREDAAAGGFDDERLYEEIALAPERRTVPSRRLLGDEAAALFDEWRAMADRTPY